MGHIAILALALMVNAGKVSLVAVAAPLPEIAEGLAAKLGGRLEMQGDFSDLVLSARLENEEPPAALRHLLEGTDVDFYVRGRGEFIILQRRGKAGGRSTVFAPPAPASRPGVHSAAEEEADRAVEFISKLGQLTPEETKRLREELRRNW